MPNNHLHGAMRRALHLSVVLALILAVAPAVPEPSAIKKPAGPFHDWKALRLKVKSAAPFSGRIWMRRTAGTERVTLETETLARLFGIKAGTSRTRTILDAGGRPTSFVSYTDKRGRRYTFGAKDILVERIFPDAERPSAPLSDWTVSYSDRFDYPTDAQGKRLPVFDYYAMLLYLQRTDLAAVGDEIVVHVATSSGPQPFRILVAEVRAADLEYQPLDEKSTRTVVVREMRLRILPADPESSEGFLKMKGETELWVEADTKTVLRIGGRVPKAGNIILELAEIG
jgi:hypothetical protein